MRTSVRNQSRVNGNPNAEADAKRLDVQIPKKKKKPSTLTNHDILLPSKLPQSVLLSLNNRVPTEICRSVQLLFAAHRKCSDIGFAIHQPHPSIQVFLDAYVQNTHQLQRRNGDGEGRDWCKGTLFANRMTLVLFLQKSSVFHDHENNRKRLTDTYIR